MTPTPPPTPDPVAAQIRAGRLTRTSRVVADPGNPGGAIALFTTRAGSRVLVGLDGAPGPDGVRRLVTVPVPATFTDPLAAAAWSYDDPTHPVRCTPGIYALLTRRT